MPITIQNMTSSYVTITSHVLTAFDLWEQAEVLTRKNKGKGLCAGAFEGLGVRRKQHCWFRFCVQFFEEKEMCSYLFFHISILPYNLVTVLS